MSLEIPQLIRWSQKGIMAILDQGLFSGAYFVINLLLARWLTSSEYGAFSVSFAIYLFVVGFYIALILEPASVLGPAHLTTGLKEYLTGLLGLHFPITILASLVLAGVAILMIVVSFGNQLVARAIIGNSISLTFVLLIWLVRRIFYILQQPGWAVLSSFLFFICFTGGVFVFYSQGLLSAFNAYITCGLAAIVGSVVPLSLNRGWFQASKNPKSDLKQLLFEHWRFGQWRTGASLLAITYGQLQTFLTAAYLGLEAAGSLRALQNLIQPMIQIETAIESLGLPVISREFGKGNIEGARKRSFFISAVLVVAAVGNFIFLFLFAQPLVNLLYSGKYSKDAWLVGVLGLMPIFLALAVGFTLQLVASGKPKYYLVVYSVNTPISLIGTIFLLRYFGIAGSAWSLVIPTIVTFPVALVLYYLWAPGRKRGLT
jgi:O-antigen/teichoic acid export membrane protein